MKPLLTSTLILWANWLVPVYGQPEDTSVPNSADANQQQLIMGGGSIAGTPHATPSSMSPESNNLIGQFFYYNNSGVAYYKCNPVMSEFPALPRPVNLGGGYFPLCELSWRTGYWLSPSGHYYPWCPVIVTPGITNAGRSQIFKMVNGAPAATRPPLTVYFAEMEQFIEEAKSKDKLTLSSYENLSRRLRDITSRYSRPSSSSSGDSREEEIYTQLDLLAKDLARALIF